MYKLELLYLFGARGKKVDRREEGRRWVVYGGARKRIAGRREDDGYVSVGRNFMSMDMHREYYILCPPLGIAAASYVRSSETFDDWVWPQHLDKNTY